MKTVKIAFVVPDNDLNILQKCVQNALQYAGLGDFFMSQWIEKESTQKEQRDYKAYLREMIDE